MGVNTNIMNGCGSNGQAIGQGPTGPAATISNLISSSVNAVASDWEIPFNVFTVPVGVAPDDLLLQKDLLAGNYIAFVSFYVWNDSSTVADAYIEMKLTNNGVDLVDTHRYHFLPKTTYEAVSIYSIPFTVTTDGHIVAFKIKKDLNDTGVKLYERSLTLLKVS